MRALPQRRVVQRAGVQALGQGAVELLQGHTRDTHLPSLSQARAGPLPLGNRGRDSLRGNRHALRQLPLERRRAPRGVGPGVRDLPRDGGVEVGVAVVPQGRPVPARGPPSRGGMCQLPHQRRHEGDADRLLRLSLDSAAGRPVPDPAGHAVRAMPPSGGLGAGAVEPRCEHRVPAEPRAPGAALRQLPQGRPVCVHEQQLRRLPPGGLLARCHTQPRRGRLPDQLRGVPHGRADLLAPGDLRSRRAASRSSARTRSRRARRATRTTSSGHAARLRRLPPTDYQRTANPNHAAAGFPTDVRIVPPRDRPHVARRRRSTTRASSRSSASTRRRPAPRATRTASTRARRATASAATRPTTRGRPTRTTRLPGSPPPASVPPVVGQRPGGAAAFNHASVFPLVGVHATQAVPRATRTPSTRARRATASAATRPTTSARTNPNHAAAGFPTTCETVPLGSLGHVVGELRSQPRSSRSSACTSGRRARPATRTTSTAARRRDCVGCHLADYQRTAEPESHGGRFPHDLRVVPPASDSVVEPGHVQPHVVPDHVGAPRRPRVLVVPHDAEQLRGLHAARPATRGRRPTRTTPGCPATGTTRPPATPATRTGARRPESSEDHR